MSVSQTSPVCPLMATTRSANSLRLRSPFVNHHNPLKHQMKRYGLDKRGELQLHYRTLKMQIILGHNTHILITLNKSYKIDDGKL